MRPAACCALACGLADDEDLASLRADPRFAAFMTRLAR